jgi:hypothetical protein
MVGEVIISPAFTSTSRDLRYTIQHFADSDDAVIFQFLLHGDAVAADIQHLSAFPAESEVLIAASSTFRVDGLSEMEVPPEWSSGRVRVLPMISLSSYIPWYDLDIDREPPRFLIESPPAMDGDNPGFDGDNHRSDDGNGDLRPSPEQESQTEPVTSVPSAIFHPESGPDEHDNRESDGDDRD